MMASYSNRYPAWTYKVLLLVSILDFADLQSACSSAAVTGSIPDALYCFNNEVVSAPRLILDAFEVKQSTSSECRCRVTSDMNTTVTLSAYQGMNAADDCKSTVMVNVGGTFSVINCFISGSFLVDDDELVLRFYKPIYNYSADYCILITPDNSAKLTIKCDGDPLPTTPITQLSTTLLSTSTTSQLPTFKATTTSVETTTTMSSLPISSTSSMTSIETSQLGTTVMSTSTNSPTTQQQTAVQTISTHDFTTQRQTTVPTTSAHGSTTQKQTTVQTISSLASTTQQQTPVQTTSTPDLTSKLQTDLASVSPIEDKTTSHQMSTTPLKVTTTAVKSSTTSSASSSQSSQTTSVSSSEQSVTSPTSTFSKTITGVTTESSVVSTMHAGSTTESSRISTTTPRRITTPSKMTVSNTNDDIEWSWIIPLIGGGIIIIIGIVIGCCYCYRKENSKQAVGELHDGYQDKAFINYAYDAVEDPEFTSEVNNAFLVDEPVNHNNTKSKLPDINTIILEDSKASNSDPTNQTRGAFIRYSVKEYPQTKLYASVINPTNQHLPFNTVVNEPTAVYAGVNKSNNTAVPMYATVDKLNNETGPAYTSANKLNKGLDIYY